MKKNAKFAKPTKIQKINRANPAFPDNTSSKVAKDIWTSDRKFRQSELQIQSFRRGKFPKETPNHNHKFQG